MEIMMSFANKVIAWCGSVAGFLTILILLVTFGRISLTLLREKYGKDSSFYRIIKGFPTIICVIYIINMIAHFFGKATSGIGLAAGSLTETVLTTQWMLISLWALVYVILIGLASSSHAEVFLWSGTILAVMGSYALWHNGFITAVVAVLAISVLVAFGEDMEYFWPLRKHEVEECDRCIKERVLQGLPVTADESQSVTGEAEAQIMTSRKHKFLFGVLWLASLIVAYMAGEYSLIPRLSEYLSRKVKKAQSVKSKAETDSCEIVVVRPTK